jgi:carbon-monoxide dehydrogenase large subunit
MSDTRTAPKFGVGQPVHRLEDPRLLTGKGLFTDDLVLENQAHGIVLRSPHAHARIDAMDLAAARQVAGVLAIYTAADIASLGTIQCMATVQQADGSDLKAPPFPILAEGKAVYVGQPVAFVVAETVAAAKQAAESIDVTYDPLPAAVDTASANDPTAPEIWESIPRNTSFLWRDGDHPAVERALAEAPHRRSLRVVNNRLIAASVEPRIAIGEWDGTRLTLTTTSQGPHSLRLQLAEHLFHLPEESIRVVTHEVGGGFGMKIFMYPEQPLVLFAARDLGRPVRWIGERSADAFPSDYHGRDQVNDIEVGFDDDGRILVLNVRTNANLGAFVSNFAPYIATECGAAMLSGVYAIPAIAVEVHGVFTNTVPVDAYRGAGHPEAIYVIERTLDAVGRELGLDAATIRRRNFIQPEQLPYTTAMNWTYDSGDFGALLDKALGHAAANTFAARRMEAAKRGKLRGLGIAHYVKGVRAGMGEAARLEIAPDGTATVYIGNQSNGQGHETVFAQAVAERLGIDLERISLVQGDTDRVRTGHGTGGSRSMLNGIPACDRAAVAVIENGTRLAADALEAAEADIEYEAGIFRIAGTDRRMTLGEVAATAADRGQELDGDGHFTADGMTFPNGCHACEVEIDPETGAVRLIGYWAVDDFGRLINPLLLEGQVQGGLAQGIGQALFEHCVYDGSGQLISGSFMDYCLPRADDLPDMSVELVEDYPCTTNPMGIKGAGEAGAVGAPPTVVNALLDALAPLGITHIDMPATPERIWRTIQETK